MLLLLLLDDGYDVDVCSLLQKMHCSGKIVHESSLPKGKKSSNNVVLLFCNPFMLRAAEFTTDLQKNVFWSKHDLDLNIKEVDKK